MVLFPARWNRPKKRAASLPILLLALVATARAGTVVSAAWPRALRPVLSRLDAGGVLGASRLLEAAGATPVSFGGLSVDERRLFLSASADFRARELLDKHARGEIPGDPSSGDFRDMGELVSLRGRFDYSLGGETSDAYRKLQGPHLARQAEKALEKAAASAQEWLAKRDAGAAVAAVSAVEQKVATPSLADALLVAENKLEDAIRSLPEDVDDDLWQTFAPVLFRSKVVFGLLRRHPDAIDERAALDRLVSLRLAMPPIPNMYVRHRAPAYASGWDAAREALRRVIESLAGENDEIDDPARVRNFLPRLRKLNEMEILNHAKEIASASGDPGLRRERFASRWTMWNQMLEYVELADLGGIGTGLAARLIGRADFIRFLDRHEKRAKRNGLPRAEIRLLRGDVRRLARVRLVAGP